MNGNWTITAQWYEGNFDSGEPVYYYSKIYGLKRYMQGYSQAVACFGTFEVQGRHIVHSFYAGDNRSWTKEETFDDGHNDSHMLDDILYFLMKGNVEFVDI